MILLSVCVMCVVWTGYYPGSKKRSSQGRPHRTPHSTSFFGLILTGLTILPLTHFAEVVTACQRRRLHHGGPQPTLPESPSQPAPTQLVITVDVIFVILTDLLQKEKKKKTKTKKKWCCGLILLSVCGMCVVYFVPSSLCLSLS